MSGDIVAFLRARLDDDERVARAAGGCAWDPPAKAGYPAGHDAHLAAEEEHIARHDPARVLADVDAKRAILDRCEYELNTYVGPSTQVALAYLSIKQLARPYAGHPDYRDEWRP